MTKRGDKPQSNHHLMIYDEDWQFLSEHYGPNGLVKGMSISEVVKKIVHQKIFAMRQKLAERLDREHAANNQEEIS